MAPLQFSVIPNQHRAPYDIPALKPLRPPIYNPFDKFPQPEFDAWIGDLTNALKGALGKLDDAGQPQTPASSDIGYTPVLADETVEEVVGGSSVDDEVEDSFADIKARRVIRKGKARDPREGPGFGTGMGEKNQPIEIGSDSDELEEDGESEVGSEQWDMEEQDGEEEEEKDEDEEDEEEEEDEDEESVEEEDQSWLQGESSIQARIRSEGDNLNDHYEYQDGGENEEDYELDEGSDVEYEAIGRPQKREFPEGVMLLSSDEELDGDEGACGKNAVDDYDGHSDQSDAEEAPAIMSRSSPFAMNDADQDEMDSFNELEYPVASYEVDGKRDVDIDEDEQPVDEDTSFPSPTISPTMFQQPVDIPDPWSGPKTYAEDFYSGGDVRASFDGQITADNLGMYDDRNGPPLVPPTRGKHDLKEQVMKGDVHKLHSPLLASDSQDIDMLEVYSDIEVYQQEESPRQTGISTAGEHHALEFSDHGASFTAGPSGTQVQEETYTDLSELSSTVNELHKMEACVIQEPVVDEVETVTPLITTHGSDLECNAKPLSPSVIVDKEDIEEISSSTPGSPLPVVTERSEEESSAPPQHHIFGGLPTPELDDTPTTNDGPQTPGYSEVVQHAVAERSPDVPGSLPNPETGKQIDDLATKSADENEMPVFSATDSAYQQDSFELPNDIEQTSTARHLSFHAEERRAGASTNDLQAHTELGSGSPVEEPRSDIDVSAPMTTIPLAGNAEVFNVYEEPTSNKDWSVAVASPHSFATTPTVADSINEHSAEALMGLAKASKVLEERYATQAQVHAADQASDKAFHSPEKNLLSSSNIVDDHATPSDNRYGRLGPEDQESTTDNRELPHSAIHDTALPSPSHMLPHVVPSAPYPMRMIMRNATDPVLFADPYPYSLSTPGQIQDEIFDDEETEQEYSLSSSSTSDKYSDDKAKESDATASGESAQRNDHPKLQSPSEPVEVDNSGSFDARQPIHYADSSIPEQRNADNDTDADGDVDPEYSETDAMSSPAHSSSTRGPDIIEDPFRDADVTSSTNQREDKAAELGHAKKRVEPAEQQNSHLSTTATTPVSRSAGELPAIFLLRKKPAEEIQNNGSAEAKQSPSSEQLHVDLIPASRSSKRKRDTPSDASTKKQERSSAARQVAQRPRKSGQAREAQPVKSHKHSAGKGKAKASQSRSHNTSRASSIVSSAPSDRSSQSIYMHSSPTIDKVTALRPRMAPPLLNLLHTHSRAVSHHHSLPSPVFQLPVQRSIQRTNSIARHTDSPRSAGATPPYHLHKSSSFSSSSPVTRSHCRYHKISIPRDEDDGPREYFLVPGCSLGNADLINEELIEDHGDATPDDADRSVNDIASLEGLNPYLVGIMRQLVGLDRDQEVYYVPPHGQEPVRNSRHPKTPSDKLPLARIPSHEQMTATSANGSFRSPTSSRAPLSTSGSVSTSASLPRKEMDFDPPSAMSSPGSDFSDDDGSPLKRARTSSTGDKVPSASRVSRKTDLKKRARVPEAVGESDIDSPQLKKQKTYSSDETVGSVVVSPNM